MALTCLAGAVTQASTLGWSNAWIIGGLAAGTVLFTAFLAIEAWSSQPMMPLDLFRSAAFSTATFVGTIANFVFYGLVFVFSLFFQTAQGKSAFATGLAFVPMTALIMFVNVAAGRLIGRFGMRPVMLTGICIASVGYLAMLSIGTDTSYAAITPIFAVAGVGIALIVPSVMTAALAGTQPGRAGGVVQSQVTR